MDNWIGKNIGRYHILEQIGEGGMAIVYKAYDTRLESEVALKVIRTDLFPPAALERVLKRFEREAKSLARLNHPNIVKVIDYGEHDGSPYLVMSYLPGGTLKERTGQRMLWQDAISLLIPIARALAYAHSEGLLHRDVKPSNILITKSGEPVLTDFGIAKLLEPGGEHTLTGTGVGVGTPEYMAPEQGLGKDVDERADVYAMGVVLYEMVTGHKPYTADTPIAVVVKQVNDPLPRPVQFVPGLPGGVEQVLFKSLAKKPEDRYTSMDDFAVSLEKLARMEKHQLVSFAPPSAKPIPQPTPAVQPNSIVDPECTYDGTPIPIAPLQTSNKSVPVWVWGMAGLVMLGVIGLGLKGVKDGILILKKESTPMVIFTTTPMPPKTEVHLPTMLFTPTPLLTSALEKGSPLLSETPKNKPSPTQEIKPTSQIVSGAIITYSTKFDEMNEFLSNWGTYNNVDLIDGIITITGNSGIGRKNSLSVGDGILVLFRCSEGSDSNIVLYNKRFYGTKYIGIKPNEYIITSIGNESGWIGGQLLSGDMNFVINHWYYGLVKIKLNGEFYIKVWDKENPDNYLEKSLPMGENWENEDWYGSINTNEHNKGGIDVDSYQELNFQ